MGCEFPVKMCMQKCRAPLVEVNYIYTWTRRKYATRHHQIQPIGTELHRESDVWYTGYLSRFQICIASISLLGRYLWEPANICRKCLLNGSGWYCNCNTIMTTIKKNIYIYKLCHFCFSTIIFTALFHFNVTRVICIRRNPSMHNGDVFRNVLMTNFFHCPADRKDVR